MYAAKYPFKLYINLLLLILIRHLYHHKKRSWNKAAFGGIHKIALTNIFLLWNLLFPEQKLTYTKFLVKLANDLARKPKGKIYYLKDYLKYTGEEEEHIMHKPKSGPYVGKTGRCNICKKSTTVYRCWQCNIWVHEPCWEEHIQ